MAVLELFIVCRHLPGLLCLTLSCWGIAGRIKKSNATREASRSISRNSKAGNGCANFYVHLGFGNPHAHELLVLGGGYLWVFWGGRGECQFYSCGRLDLISIKSCVKSLARSQHDLSPIEKEGGRGTLRPTTFQGQHQNQQDTCMPDTLKLPGI